MDEARDLLAKAGIHIDLLRIRGFPFGDEVTSFITTHEKTFVLEQNREGQLRALLINELELNPAHIIKIVHFDGAPITAGFVTDVISNKISSLKGA